jgi:phosphatidylserine decarboxylase
MSPLDVHVNRLAVSGQIESVQYHPGKFRPAFAEEAVYVNEQNAVIIQIQDERDGQNEQNEQNRRGRKIALVQIAGILARRIVCQLKGGERVELGARYGMIMLGSRVDVYCPPDIELKVEIGQRVKAGETILGVYPQSWPKA